MCVLAEQQDNEDTTNDCSMSEETNRARDGATDVKSRQVQ